MSTRAPACVDARIFALPQATGNVDLLTGKNLYRSRGFGWPRATRSMACWVVERSHRKMTASIEIMRGRRSPQFITASGDKKIRLVHRASLMSVKRTSTAQPSVPTRMSGENVAQR